VFIVLDPRYSGSVLPRALAVAKTFVGEGWVEAYAEHPYIRAEVDGFDVEFVPCFRVDPREGLISATDRTPLHTRFVEDHLDGEAREGVRLLKQFMRGVGVYGAEVKTGGFSGYLCELLVIRFGSFEAILRDAVDWRRGEVIDITGGADPDALRRRFRGPLVVVDPVDPRRNVASPVSDTAMWTFVAAARAFTKRPAGSFFFPTEAEVEAPALLEALRSLDSSMLFLVVDDDDVDVPDVLWGQLYKAERAISRLLAKREFRVIRSTSWSDEASKHILIFELESATIPGVVRIKGPPVELAESSERFLRAHLGADSTVSGPWIEGRRWWAKTRRKETDARRLLAAALEDGGRSIGVPRRLSMKITGGHEVLLGAEIAHHLRGDFTRFLDRFLKGRPAWLE
ncbi:MAG: CCA tRNA nucleotidyltransferase, partial [Candidatus Bathyarchaeia archaeon]